MSTVELVIAAAVVGVALVFAGSYRFVARRFGPGAVPMASVVAGGERWVAGQARARMASRAETLTRVAIAAGLTSIVVMGICLVGMIVLGIAANA
jgi:hypothetical protein